MRNEIISSNDNRYSSKYGPDILKIADGSSLEKTRRRLKLQSKNKPGRIKPGFELRSVGGFPDPFELN